MAEAVYDPFEEFNRAQAGMGKVRDPYPEYAELRRRGPVHKLSLRELLGRPCVAPGMPDDIYSVVTHDAVAQVLRDGETFSSTGYGALDGPRDGPHHPRDGRARALALPRADPAGLHASARSTAGSASWCARS